MPLVLIQKHLNPHFFGINHARFASPQGKVVLMNIMSYKSSSEETLRVRLFNRRNFLKAAGSAAILPAVLPGFAQSSGASANNRINLGVIGMGWQGTGNTQSFLASDD